MIIQDFKTKYAIFFNHFLYRLYFVRNYKSLHIGNREKAFLYNKQLLPEMYFVLHV